MITITNQNQLTLARIGMWSAFILGIVQLAGIIMHGSIPAVPSEGLSFIKEHALWKLTHIILIVSYLFAVSFYEGLRGALNSTNPFIEWAKHIVIIGAFLGAVHFIIHYSAFFYLAEKSSIVMDEATQSKIEILYSSFYWYAQLLNRISFSLLMLVAIFFSIAFIQEKHFKKWLGIFGLISSSVSFITMLVVDLFLERAVGDIVFAISLLPTIIWIILVGCQLHIQLKKTPNSF